MPGAATTRARSILVRALVVGAPALCAMTCSPPRGIIPPPPAERRTADGPARIDPALRDAEPGEWVRVAVEHRTQAMPGVALARELGSRAAARERTLALLDAVAREGRASGFEDAVQRLVDDGLASDPRWTRARSGVVLDIRADALTRVSRWPWTAVVIGGGPSSSVAASAARPTRERPPIPPGPSWAIEALGLDALHAKGIDGRGVVVGILDSGVDGRHAALAEGAAEGRPSWFDPRREFDEASDTVPHGTHVLAAAVGRAVGGRPIGAAPAASWVAARSNADNRYAYADLLLATDWMIFEARPDVVVAPWGHGPGSCIDRDRPLVDALRAAGTVPVFAAGNDGPARGSGQSPAALRGLLAVGAIDRNLRVLPESARGPRRCSRPREPFPDVVAPGRYVPVPGPGRLDLDLADGTSVASGFVAGAIALAMQVAPDLPVERVEALVRRTARDVPPDGIDDASGFGVVDPAELVRAAREQAGR